jgi:hypothetical protein
MAKKTTQTGERAIRAIFETARRQIEEAKPVDDPAPEVPRNGIKAGQWDGAPFSRLPPDCPVHVIGRDVEGTVYVLTATNDLRAVTRWDHVAIIDLFAPYPNYCYWAWPAWSKPKVDKDSGEVIEPPRVARLERDKAATAIMTAAAKRPLFDPQQQHRGRGGWHDRAGRFIWHSGTWMWTASGAGLERAKPAEHDGFLYTRQPATIEPWDAAVQPDESPALRILEDLRSWKWERPYLDPVLCLGWIATALMGGALKARPIVFTGGGAGVGKSTLHELFRNVLEDAVFSAVDTTAAGIYQRVKHDALPIMVDELENKPGSTKAQSVIELARVAYTGGDIARGGADHEGTTFKMHNSFLFSAINPPFMTEADKSRMAILNLSRLDAADGVGRKVSVAIETDGRMLLRQIMDGWKDFSTRLLQDWWNTLQAQGLDSRAIDTYGTLLAAAEMLVGPAALEEIGLPVTDQNHLGSIIAAATALERSERLENWHKCVNRLLDSTIEAWRDGVKPTIGGVMEELERNNMGPVYARERLQLVNLGLRDRGDPAQGFCLAVPNDGPVLQRIFADTEWQRGGWFGALKQAPGDVVRRNDGNKQKVKINGSTKHCLLIDMAAFQAYVEKEGQQ